MKIAIHGTKGGYETFTPERIPGLIDARPDSHKIAAIGQQAYAINFYNATVIFSKYRIIRDAVGEKRMGNIAFSSVISNNEKLSGTDIKALLDQLSDEYSKYLEGDNLHNVREDWAFVEVLTKEYASRLQPVTADDVETIPEGKGDAAFIYYSTDEELQKYFDAPYQEEYKLFKQIFFVKKDFERQPENPLNALRHNLASNLTGQIDLENPQYKLLFNEHAKGGIRIEVRVNGNKRYNKSKIRRKSELEIIYTKPYYHELRLKGKWSDISPDFVTADDTTQTVHIREADLPAEVKTVTIEARDAKLNPIYDAEITIIGINGQQRRVLQNEIAFWGEELKARWTVSGKKGNFSGNKEFTPENQTGSVLLILEERRIVSFNVCDDKGLVYDYKLQIQHKNIRSGEREIEFIGQEIEKTWDVIISHNKYGRKVLSYCPAKDENPQYVNLQKMQTSGERPTSGEERPTSGERLSSGERQANREYYKVSAGEYGTLKDGKEYSSNRNDGADVKDKIVPQKGYGFTGFECRNGTLTAQYQRKEPFYNSPKFLAGCAVLIIGTILCILLIPPDLNPKPNSAPKPINIQQEKAQEIINYCEGIELNIQKLEQYKNTYCSENMPDYCPGLDNAIAIRTAINRGQIDQLQNRQYYDAQMSFRNTIINIDSRYQDKIGEAMRIFGVSYMDLDKVADFIARLQALLKIEMSSLKSESDCDAQLQEVASLELPDIEIVKSVKAQIESRKDVLKKMVATPENTNRTSSQREKSAPPLQAVSNPQRPVTSTLKTGFWELVRRGDVTKENYDNLLRRHRGKNLNPEEQAIIHYLEKICNKSTSFRKFSDINEIKRKTATTLSQIEF